MRRAIGSFLNCFAKKTFHLDEVVSVLILEKF